MAKYPAYTPGGSPAGTYRSPGRAQPGATLAMQARASRTEEAFSHLYACSRCAIRYEVPKGDKPRCPMCELDKQLEAAKVRIGQLQDENTNLTRRVVAVQTQVDHVMAIREAMPLAVGDDLTFLKSVMYLYRDDRSHQLTALRSRVAMDSRGRVAKNQPVRNEMALTRAGDRTATTHVFTSIGGVAIVGYFDEMTREVGEKQAMSYLLRAVSLYLSKAE